MEKSEELLLEISSLFKEVNYIDTVCNLVTIASSSENEDEKHYLSGGGIENAMMLIKKLHRLEKIVSEISIKTVPKL